MIFVKEGECDVTYPTLHVDRPLQFCDVLADRALCCNVLYIKQVLLFVIVFLNMYVLWEKYSLTICKEIAVFNMWK